MFKSRKKKPIANTASTANKNPQADCRRILVKYSQVRGDAKKQANVILAYIDAERARQPSKNFFLTYSANEEQSKKASECRAEPDGKSLKANIQGANQASVVAHISALLLPGAQYHHLANCFDIVPICTMSYVSAGAMQVPYVQLKADLEWLDTVAEDDNSIILNWGNQGTWSTGGSPSAPGYWGIGGGVGARYWSTAIGDLICKTMSNLFTEVEIVDLGMQVLPSFTKPSASSVRQLEHVAASMSLLQRQSQGPAHVTVGAGQVHSSSQSTQSASMPAVAFSVNPPILVVDQQSDPVPRHSVSPATNFHKDLDQPSAAIQSEFDEQLLSFVVSESDSVRKRLFCAYKDSYADLMWFKEDALLFKTYALAFQKLISEAGNPDFIYVPLTQAEEHDDLSLIEFSFEKRPNARRNFAMWAKMKRIEGLDKGSDFSFFFNKQNALKLYQACLSVPNLRHFLPFE